MNKAISVELQFFLICILWGAILLAAYDILRIFRRVIKHNNICIAIEDLIFWVISSVFIFAMIYQKNYGIIRAFSVIGIAIGMILYHYIVSEIFVNLVTKLINTLLSPLKYAISQLRKLLLFITSKGKKLINFLLLRLKNKRKLVTMKLSLYKKKREEKIARRLKKKADEKAVRTNKKAEIKKKAEAKRKAEAKKKAEANKKAEVKKKEEQKQSEIKSKSKTITKSDNIMS